MNAAVAQEAPTTITIAKPNPQHVAAATDALAIANSFVIDGPDTAAIASDEIRSIKAKLESLEEERTKITKPLNEALRAVNALFKRPTELLESASRILRSKLVTYQDGEEKKRREAQAAAEEAARKERERLAKEAEKLEKKGKVEQAEAKRDLAASIPAPVAAPVEAIAGVGMRKNWKARTKGDNWKRELIAFIAGVPVEKLKRPEFDYLLDLNESKAHGLAKQCEKADLGIPGLEGFNDKIAAVR